MLKQAIELPGVGNARELGGYAIADKHVKSGVLLRSAGLDRASSEALERLESDYRLQALVDLRMSMEQTRLPDPQVPGATNYHLPVMEIQDFPVPEGLDPAAFDLLNDPKANKMKLFDIAYEYGMVGPDLYVNFVMGARGKKAYADFFRILLDLDDDRAVLWHCTDGKDRTGCASALLLSALGADRQTVREDYLLTNEFNAPLLAATQQRLAGRPMPQDKLDALLFMVGKVSEAYLNRAFDAIEQSYGSVEGYLRDELGVGAEETRLLRDKFLA
jgi:protein-tyrosine phosphatase